MNEEQKSFVKDLIRVSILDIVRPNEIQTLIDEDIFEFANDVNEIIRDVERYLRHRCHSRCLACVGHWRI